MYYNLPNSASILITERCNLGCLYCFQHDRKREDISIDVLHKSLDYLCNNAIEQKKDNFHVMIFGGEPLLRPDLVKELLDYGYKLQWEKEIRFTATLITNGTIMNDDIFWLLTQYKNLIGLTTQLSVDGVKESHDLYRKTKNGNGSFDLIERNIEKFKKIYQDQPEKLSVHGCINKQTIDKVFENYLFFNEEWKIDNIWFMPIHEEDWDENDVKTYKSQMYKIANHMLDDAKRYKDIDILNIYTPINKCFSPNKKVGRTCGAGNNFISIVPNGDIYPCHFFYFNNPENNMKIGNVYNGIDEESKTRQCFVMYDTDLISCDKDCDNYNCYRCMGANFIKNNHPMRQIRGYYCQLSKIDKEITDYLRNEIRKLSFIDLENIKYMDVEDRWVEGDIEYTKYTSLIGEEIIKERKISNDEQEKIKKHYEENGMEILSSAIMLTLNKINDLEYMQKQIRNMLFDLVNKE